MFKKIILVVLIALTLGTIGLSQTNQQWLSPLNIKEIDNPKWSLIVIDPNGTVVTWG